MRLGTVAAVIMGAALAAPATAAASDAVFARPTALGIGSQPPAVAMAANGEATVAWMNDSGNFGPIGTQVAEISPTAGLRWQTRLDPHVGMGAAVSLARNDAGLIAVGVPGWHGPAVVVGHTSGRFGGVEQVPLPADTGSFLGALPPAIAVTPDGTVVVMFLDVYDGGVRVVAAWRAPGGTWSAPQVLPFQTQATPQLAADGQGGVHALLMDGWESWNQIVTTDWSPSTGFGPVTPLGPASPYMWDGGSLPAIAANRRGDVVAAWSPSEVPPAGQGPRTWYDRVDVTRRPAGGAWEPVHTVSTPTGGRQQNPAVAVNDAGDTIVTWQADGIGSAFRPADHRWQPAQYRQGALGFPAILPTAVDALGNAVTIRTTASDGSAQLAAATRPRDGAFGPDSDVYADGHELYAPALAMDPYGNGLAAWLTMRPDVTPPPEGPSLLMVSTYSAQPPQVTAATAARKSFQVRVDEPAQVAVRLRDRRGRTATLSGVARPLRRTKLPYTPAARRLLHRPGRYRATVVARDRGPQRPQKVRISFRRK